MDTADSSVPRSRALIIPQGEIEAPKIGEVIFEKQKYRKKSIMMKFSASSL